MHYKKYENSPSGWNERIWDSNLYPHTEIEHTGKDNYIVDYKREYKIWKHFFIFKIFQLKYFYLELFYIYIYKYAICMAIIAQST